MVLPTAAPPFESLTCSDLVIRKDRRGCAKRLSLIRRSAAYNSPPRQEEMERRPPCLYVFGREIPTLGLGEVAGYRQSETCSSATAGTRGVCSIEAIEDTGKVLGCYPWAGIDDARLHPTVARMASYGDASPRRRVPEGVVEEYGQDALRLPRVAAGRELLRGPDLQPDTLDNRPGLEAAHGARNHC